MSRTRARYVIKRADLVEMLSIVARTRGGDDYYRQPLFYPSDFVGPPAPVAYPAAVGALRAMLERLEGQGNP